LHVDIIILLGINALINGVMYGVITTISTTFERIYSFLTVTTIGLCFLAYGGGMIAGSAITGKVLDREYRRFVRKVEHGGGDSDLKRTDAGREAMDLERVRKFLPKVCSGDTDHTPSRLACDCSLPAPLYLEAASADMGGFYNKSFPLPGLSLFISSVRSNPRLPFTVTH
jgi:hypothetical protein